MNDNHTSPEPESLQLPPFAVLRESLSVISLAHYKNPGPSPRTWHELISAARRLNTVINEPFIGIQHPPPRAWSLVSNKLGERGAATASIFAASLDLIRAFDIDPQRLFLQAAEDAVDPNQFSLDGACSALLSELRWLRHPAPPRAPDHLPSLKAVHSALTLIDPEWSPLSEDAGWVGVYYDARHDISIDHGLSSDTWTRLRDALGHHGAAVAVIIAAVRVSAGQSPDCEAVFRQLLDLHMASALRLDVATAELLLTGTPRTHNGS